MSDAPLIYVDLIEEEPLDAAEWAKTADVPLIEADNAYRAYRLAFQPWRILVKSGDNEEALFRSTERYFNEGDVRHAADLAFGPHSNVYLRQKEHGNVALRLAAAA